MRRIWGTVLVIIFLASVVHSTSVVETPEKEDAKKKEADDATTHDTKFSDDDLDETILDNLKHLFQQLKEIKVLRDSMMKLVTTSDLLTNEKSLKDKTSDSQNKERANEESSADGLPRKEAWAQIFEAAKAAGIDAFSALSTDDPSANWDPNNSEEQVIPIPPEEEPQEPLNPEQQEGDNKQFPHILTHKNPTASRLVLFSKCLETLRLIFQ